MEKKSPLECFATHKKDVLSTSVYQWKTSNQPTNQRSCANKACAVTSPLSSVHPEKIHLQIHGGTLKKNTQGILIFNPGLSNSGHMLAGYQQLMLLLRYLLILANQGLIAPFGGLSSSDSCDDTK